MKRGMSVWGGHHNLPAPRYAPRSWNTLSVMEDSLRDMDRQFNQMFRDVNSLFREFRIPEFIPQDILGMESKVVTEGDQKKYLMNVFLGESVTPENVKVNLKDRVMTIEAKVDQKSEDGNTRVYQEISRKFVLPEHVNPKEVKSIMGPDGILKIEAPIPPEAIPEPKPKEIPIQME